MIGRTTLGSVDAPETNILAGTGNIIFSSGKWSATVPDIIVDTFAFPIGTGVEKYSRCQWVRLSR